MNLPGKHLLVLSLVMIPLLGACTERTILPDMGEPANPVHGSALSIWFVKAEGGTPKVVRVYRRSSSSQRLEEAVRELLSGPTAQEAAAGMGSEIPRGTILLGVTSRGPQAEVDLSRRFASGGGVTSLQCRLDQLQQTVRDAAGPAKVYLSVEGKRLELMGGEGIEVPQPLNP